jgi:hypothetical protein
MDAPAARAPVSGAWQLATGNWSASSPTSRAASGRIARSSPLPKNDDGGRRSLSSWNAGNRDLFDHVADVLSLRRRIAAPSSLSVMVASAGE